MGRSARGVEILAETATLLVATLHAPLASEGSTKLMDLLRARELICRCWHGTVARSAARHSRTDPRRSRQSV
jgi:hypothetical protein